MGLPLIPMLQIGMAGVSAFASMGATNANAKAAYKANERQIELLSEDVARRKDEAQTQLHEAVSDRVMRANQEIAVAELMAAERGASASTMQSMVRHLATVEGIDLSRIRGSYRSQIDSLDSELNAGIENMNNANQQTYNQAKTQNMSAVLGAVGSGLQIGSSYQYRQASLDAARNKT